MSGSSQSPSLYGDQHNSRHWSCAECHQPFQRSKLLEDHAIETDHRAYRCTKEKHCQKSFILRPSWIHHERLHLVQKAHACSRCSKRFHRRDNCHDHERTCGRASRRARPLPKPAPTLSAASHAPIPTNDALWAIEPSAPAPDPPDLQSPAGPGNDWKDWLHLFQSEDPTHISSATPQERHVEDDELFPERARLWMPAMEPSNAIEDDLAGLFSDRISQYSLPPTCVKYRRQSYNSMNSDKSHTVRPHH